MIINISLPLLPQIVFDGCMIYRRLPAAKPVEGSIMWRAWFEFWIGTALTTQSMYLSWINPAFVPVKSQRRRLSPSDHRPSQSAAMAAISCPACDATMRLTTRQRTSGALARWLSCTRCGVSQLLLSSPGGTGTNSPKHPPTNDASPERRVRKRTLRP